MPPLTGYESEDEWQRKTNAHYGHECRQAGIVLGMIGGAITAGAVLLGNMAGMHKGQVRLYAGIGAFVGLWVGAAVGWSIGYFLDHALNPRTRRREGKSRVRVRGKGKKRRVDFD